MSVSPPQLVNFIGNDGLRIWYGVIMGPFIIGGPIILIMSCAYSIVYMGPWALLAWLVIIGFYPFAVSLGWRTVESSNDAVIHHNELTVVYGLLTVLG